MNYTFFGDEFFFVKYCDNLDVVKATIDRCNRPFRTSSYTIHKKIARVVDELGIEIFNRHKKRIS